MTPATLSREIRLILPADMAYAPVATLAMSGLGMVVGMDVDLLGDLRTVIGECMDCLIHQSARPCSIDMTAGVENGRLWVRFAACQRRNCEGETPLSPEITRGVLETLMPEVALNMDENGVHGIECSMPV